MSDRAHIRVMALDDEPFMLNVLQRTLAQLGYLNVSAYGDAHHALLEMDHHTVSRISFCST